MGVYDYHKEKGEDLPPEAAVMDPGEAALRGNGIKTYVKVVASFAPDGRITPIWIVWEDGRRYAVDRVLSVDRAASLKAGGCGVRYRCRVCGNIVELFYEGGGRWFVSRKAGRRQK